MPCPELLAAIHRAALIPMPSLFLSREALSALLADGWPRFERSLLPEGLMARPRAEVVAFALDSVRFSRELLSAVVALYAHPVTSSD